MFEYQEQIKNPEKEEMILKVIISRHGPKLSASGEKNALAEYFSKSVQAGFDKMNIKEGEGLVHISTSPVKRAVDTANIYSAKIKETNHRIKENITTKESLEVPFQPIDDAEDERFADDLDLIVEMQKEIEPNIRKEIEKEFPDLTEEEKESEIRNKIDMLVLEEMFNDEEKDIHEKKFKTSYIELADRFAKRYLGFSKHLSLLEHQKNGIKQSSEPYLQIDVSHSFPITSFLKKYLIFSDGKKAEEMSSLEFFEKTGGIVRESGSFEMDYMVVNGKKIIKIKGEFEKGREFNGTINLV